MNSKNLLQYGCPISRVKSMFFAVMIFGFVGGTFAARDPEIDISRLYQDIVLEDKDAGDRATMVDKIVDGRDLFRSSLAFENYKRAQTNSVALNKVYEHITGYLDYCPGGLLYTMEDAVKDLTSEVYLHPHPISKAPVEITLSKKDIVNVYTLTEHGLRDLALLNSDRAFAFEEVTETDESFLSSCKWIVGCHQGMQKINFDGSRIEDSEIPGTTVDERKICDTIVSDLFEVYKTQVESSLDYDENRDREIYYNNVLEEDRLQICDVNQELETIGKMLGSSTDAIPKYSFFDPQNISKNSKSSSSGGEGENEVRLPSEYESEEENIPEESTFDTIIQDVPYKSVPDDITKKEVTGDYLGGSNNGKNIVGPSAAGGGSVDRLLAKPTQGGLSSLLTQPKSVTDSQGQSVIINPQCEVSELSAEDEDIDLYEEATDLRETLVDYSDDLDVDDRLSQALGNEKLLSAKEQETHSTADEPLIPVGDLQDDLKNYLDEMVKTDDPDVLNTMQQMEEDIKGCIEEFTDESTGTRVAQAARFVMTSDEIRECISEVFCKEITDPSGIGLYRVRFCSEMQKGVRIPTTKKVSSILDTLQSLVSVLDSMTTSGRMVKHKQATEMYEGQVDSFSWSDIAGITLNVTQNKSRTTVNPKVQKLVVTQELEEIKKVAMDELEDLSVLYPFIDNAILYSEDRVNALEQDFQIGRDFQGSLEQANNIIDELNSTTDGLHEYYMRMNNFQQIDHGVKVMEEHKQFWLEMLGMTEELRVELEKHYSSMR